MHICREPRSRSLSRSRSSQLAVSRRSRGNIPETRNIRSHTRKSGGCVDAIDERIPWKYLPLLHCSPFAFIRLARLTASQSPPQRLRKFVSGSSSVRSCGVASAAGGDFITHRAQGLYVPTMLPVSSSVAWISDHPFSPLPIRHRSSRR